MLPNVIPVLLSRRSNYLAAATSARATAAKRLLVGSDTSPTRLAANTRAIQTLMDSGDWSRLDTINFTTCDAFAGIAIPDKQGSGSATWGMSGFTSADWSASAGLTGSGTKVVQPGITMTTSSIGSAPLSGTSYGAFVLASPTTGNLAVVGSSYTPTGDTDRFYIFPASVGAGNVGDVGSAAPGFVAPGLWAAETVGATTLNIYSGGVQVQSRNDWNGQGARAGQLQFLNMGATNQFPATGVRGAVFYSGQRLNQSVLQSVCATLNRSTGRS